MLRGVIKGIVKQFGCEIRGPKSSFLVDRSLARLIEREKINLVLDVGANTGQFSQSLRKIGYSGKIISFEPQVEAHKELRKHAERDPFWIIAERCAIGAERGLIEIHVAGNSVSSSILNMLPSHSDAAPKSAYIGVETVPVNTLDNVYEVSGSDRIFLKIDVQGYEKQVLEGATGILPYCRIVHSELSLLPLYEGQVMARDLWNLLVSKGFELWSLEPGFRDSATLRLLQFDGVFVRQ